jgi:hypothetical protein
VPTGAVSFPVEKQDIPPASRADSRVVVKDSRAVRDKDSVHVVRERMVVKQRKIYSRHLQ